MTQRNRRSRQTSGSGPAKLRTPVPGIGRFSENLAADIQFYWSKFAATPIQAAIAAVAFFPTVLPVLKYFFGSSGSGSEGGSSGMFAILSSSAPMKVLTSMVVSCSIGWTWAIVVSWLTMRRREVGWGYFVAAVAGTGISAWNASFLFKSDGNTVNINDNIAFVLITAYICIAALVAKTKFKMTHETDPAIIDQRALTLLIFCASAVVLTLIVLADRLSNGG